MNHHNIKAVFENVLSEAHGENYKLRDKNGDILKAVVTYYLDKDELYDDNIVNDALTKFTLKFLKEENILKPKQLIKLISRENLDEDGYELTFEIIDYNYFKNLIIDDILIKNLTEFVSNVRNLCEKGLACRNFNKDNLLFYNRQELSCGHVLNVVDIDFNNDAILKRTHRIIEELLFTLVDNNKYFILDVVVNDCFKQKNQCEVVIKAYSSTN